MPEENGTANRPTPLIGLTLPSTQRQTTYALTGAIAGACTVPIEILWKNLSSTSKPNVLGLSNSLAPALIYRAAIRFWVFDLTRSQLTLPSIPTWLKGGLSGAAGGFAEICTQSVVQRTKPTLAALANQSSKLFVCFGTYTYLSTTLSPDQLPPKPFWYCWLMGAAAGGLGSGIVAGVEGVGFGTLVRSAVPKGSLAIGTVIAVQVTSCAGILDRLEK